MHISIVIATYNGEKYLAETIKSVQAQGYPSWELLIVDDGSTDSSAAIADAFAAQDTRIHVLRQANAGAAAARLHGCRAACPASEAFVILDHDDVWKPHTLQTLVKALEQYSEAVGAHGLWDIIDEESRPAFSVDYESGYNQRYYAHEGRLRAATNEEPTVFAMMLGWCPIKTPGVGIVRRAAMEKALSQGVFEEGMLDWDLWLYVTRYGCLAFVPQVLLSYRIHSGSMMAQKNTRMAIQQSRRRLWNSPYNTPEQKRLIRSSYRALEWYHISHKLSVAVRDLRRGALLSTLKQIIYTRSHFVFLMKGRP